MTSLTLNTTVNNTAAMVSLPSLTSVSKKMTAARNYITYSLLPKNSSRKPATKLFSIDWDLNRNELEFE